MTLLLVIAATAIVTLVIFIIGFNLTSLEKRIQHKIEPTFGVEDEQFERAACYLLGSNFTDGNKIETLENGKEYFPVMLEAIASAKSSISFETFIYISGTIGKQFSNALIERCGAGVKVNILCDWVGSWRMRRTHLRTLKDAGVAVELYRPPAFKNLVHFNNRTHRKILVIDGEVAFTGGAGIADAWNGNAEDETTWRDNQYRITGPAVGGIQGAFMDNWMQCHAEVLKEEAWFPPLKKAGNVKAQVFLSGPGEGLESARLMYLMSIACARKKIRVANAYFVPDTFVIEAMVDAAKRGVEVEIIVPHVTDSWIVQWASKSRWGPLLKAGCKIYQYCGALYHCKFIIVDDFWVSIGSSNFDTRSFRLNDEMNVNVLDRDFAAEQNRLFESDRERGKLFTLEDWDNLPALVKLRNSVAALARHQL